MNHFFYVIIGVAGTLLVELLRLFGDSRWTEYVRCGDSRAMERRVVSEWLANLEMLHAPKDCYGHDEIAQDRLVIQG